MEAAGGGTDTVYTTVDFTIGAGVEIENLLAFHIAGLTLTGNDLAQSLSGGSTMIGLGGDDTYYVGSSSQVVEAVGGGNDTIYTSENYTLPEGSEIEKIIGGNDFFLSLTGNSFNNTLLITHVRYDSSMTGGGGDDTFVFISSSQQGPRVITDMDAGDKIDVSAFDADGDQSNGDQAFILDALGDNSAAVGHVTQKLSGSTLSLFFNNGGDGTTVELLNHAYALTQGDLIA